MEVGVMMREVVGEEERGFAWMNGEQLMEDVQHGRTAFVTRVRVEQRKQFAHHVGHVLPLLDVGPDEGGNGGPGGVGGRGGRRGGGGASRRGRGGLHVARRLGPGIAVEEIVEGGEERVEEAHGLDEIGHDVAGGRLVMHLVQKRDDLAETRQRVGGACVESLLV